MDPGEIFRGHHISNLKRKLHEITDYLELVLPDTVKKRAKNPKNMGKTLNYFPYLAVEVVSNLTYCFSVK